LDANAGSDVEGDVVGRFQPLFKSLEAIVDLARSQMHPLRQGVGGERLISV
jgi:hypothetical protein